MRKSGSEYNKKNDFKKLNNKNSLNLKCFNLLAHAYYMFLDINVHVYFLSLDSSFSLKHKFVFCNILNSWFKIRKKEIAESYFFFLRQQLEWNDQMQFVE